MAVEVRRLKEFERRFILLSLFVYLCEMVVAAKFRGRLRVEWGGG